MESNIVACIFNLCLLASYGTSLGQKEVVQLLNITECSEVGGKQVIQLNTNAAILFLDESNTYTYKILQNRDIECHYELETTSTDYGFHVYYDELHIDYSKSVPQKKESIKYNDACKDYVQFGRDFLGPINSYKSEKYCGYLRKINYKTTTLDDYNREKGQGNRRFYTEGSDYEMDVWIKLNKFSDRYVKSYNRTMRLVATVYKKSCRNNDKYWRKCSNTRNCVKRKFFCDTIPNCAWPSGSYPTDEERCEGYVLTEQSEGGVAIASNIPVLIIVTIISVGCFVLIVIVCRRCIKVYKVFQQPSSPANSADDGESRIALRSTESSNNSDGRRRETSAGNLSATANPTRATSSTAQTNSGANDSNKDSTDTEGRSTAPPSYDDVVQSPYVRNVPYSDGADERTQPPPYSPRMT